MEQLLISEFLWVKNLAVASLVVLAQGLSYGS